MATFTPPKYVAHLKEQDKHRELATLQEWILVLRLHPSEVEGFVEWWDDQHQHPPDADNPGRVSS